MLGSKSGEYFLTCLNIGRLVWYFKIFLSSKVVERDFFS